MKNILFVVALLAGRSMVAQNVGIGTTTPKARLHVADSAVLFTGPLFVPGTTIYDPPASGQGARMMWYPEKAAFRAGVASATEWDKNNIGRGSVSMGFFTLASGETSFAMGSQNAAMGRSSTALGLATTAQGDFSTALGFGTFAQGNSATAMGNSTSAKGKSAMAIGFKTSARALASLSIGQYNDPIDSANDTVWVASDPVFIIGNGTGFLSQSNAMVVYKNGNTDIDGFTQLGKAAESAPAIKMKKITATSAATQNGSAFALHGLNRAKILGVQILLTYAANNDIPANYMDVPGYEFNWQLTNTDVWIITKNANSANILNKPVRILITYEE